MLIRVFTIHCLVFCLIGLVGCGASKKTKSSGSVSRGNANPNPGGSLAECIRVNIAVPQLKGIISTYYDISGMKIEFANLMLTTVPAEIFTLTTHQMQFFRWSSSVAGQRQVNQVPVRLFFADRITGMASNNTVDRISKSTLEAVKQQLGPSDLVLDQFFTRYMVVLTGLDYMYDAVAAAYYNTATGSAAISQGNFLLPPVAANPNTYMQIKPVPELYTMHPLYSYRTSNATENDYARLADEICREIAAGTRSPASVPTTAVEPEMSMWKRVWLRIVDAVLAYF